MLLSYITAVLAAPIATKLYQSAINNMIMLWQKKNIFLCKKSILWPILKRFSLLSFHFFYTFYLFSADTTIYINFFVYVLEQAAKEYRADCDIP